MNSGQQRIRIAEFCGWIHVPQAGNPNCWKHKDGRRVRTYHDLPDYLNDLNAIRQAEEKFDDILGEEFIQCLAGMMGCDGIGIWSYKDAFRVAHATAAQRSEALLKVTGAWEEEEE